MTVNTDYLRNGLRDYLSSLTAYNLVLQEEFTELSRHVPILLDIYQGEAAVAFSDSWLATARWFDEYIGGTTLLIHFLQEKVRLLEQENIN